MGPPYTVAGDMTSFKDNSVNQGKIPSQLTHPTTHKRHASWYVLLVKAECVDLKGPRNAQLFDKITTLPLSPMDLNRPQVFIL